LIYKKLDKIIIYKHSKNIIYKMYTPYMINIKYEINPIYDILKQSIINKNF